MANVCSEGQRKFSRNLSPDLLILLTVLTRLEVGGDLGLRAAAARPHLDDGRLLALQHVRHFGCNGKKVSRVKVRLRQGAKNYQEVENLKLSYPNHNVS